MPIRFNRQFRGAGPGRPKIADSMVLFDIKQAARSHCKEAIERLVGHMRSKDERACSGNMRDCKPR
jgi:hypothetical protein